MAVLKNLYHGGTESTEKEKGEVSRVYSP